MFECFILSKTEKDIINEARRNVREFREFFPISRADNAALLEGFRKQYFEHYTNLRKELKQPGTLETHEFITTQALDIIGERDVAYRSEVIGHCMDPDRHWALIKLAAEGHFYGLTRNGAYGNYFHRVFEDGTLELLRRADPDIDETALSNFAKHYTGFAAETAQLDELGCALHYLQDMTAPHHGGNYAAFFSLKSDNFDTHLAFEKFAREYLNNEGAKLQGPAEAERESLLRFIADKGLDLQDPRSANWDRNLAAFCIEVHTRIREFIPRVKSKRRSSWRAAIRGAIPVAVGATSAILENAGAIRASAEKNSSRR